jgi:hypothetical protein
MSCGTFPHPPGTAPHEHPEDATDAEAVVDDRKPGPVRTLWRNHHRVITPYLTVPAADLMATSAHFMTSGAVDAMLATLAAGIVAEGATEIRNWRGKRRPAIKATARKAILAGTVWATVASMTTPWGWEGIAQWPLLGGLIWAATFNHKNKAKPAEPAQVALPPQDDPRLEAFRRRFCEGAHAELQDANAANFVPLTRGFSLEVFFPEHTRHTISDVMGKIPQIAKLYDTSTDNVSVGYNPDHRSEARALIVVHERSLLASAKPNRWDGKPTYDPAKGMVEIGRFLDDKPVHYQLHMPRSGAAMGMAAGIPGAGKTGTISIVGAEAGLAKLCARCGPAGTCPECELQRICAVWMGDAQAQSLGIWKGKADLTGWGPEGCMELMQLAATVATDRSDVLGSLQWTDHRGREHNSKGWFDPEPGRPLIFLVLDEWPLMVGKDMGKDFTEEAIALAVKAVTVWRKVGIHTMFGTQVLDMTQTGVREIREMVKFFNLLAFRSDQVSSNMGDIKGDPTKLPRDEVGSGYVGGPDNRPDAKFRTKQCPDNAPPGYVGPDIVDIAGVIAQTPIAYDSSVTRAMEGFGLSHQQVITEWKGRGDAQGTGEPSAAAVSPEGLAAIGLPTAEEAAAVFMAIVPNEPTDRYRLMEKTGLSVLAVERSLKFLAVNGDVTQTGDDQYTAA